MAEAAEIELQDLILTTLKADPALTAIVGTAIYDQPPSDAVPPYVSFGPADVIDASSDCVRIGEHSFQIDAWSTEPGKVQAKRMTAAIAAALDDLDATLADNALVQIYVGFRQVIDDPDGVTKHGIIRVDATIEES